MAAAGGDGGGRGGGASRCYVTLKAGQPSAGLPTCGISISIDLCSVCGGAVYKKGFICAWMCMLLLPFIYWDLGFFFFFLPQVLRTHVMVRVGGGWDTLEHYLDKHDPCRCAAFGEVTSYSPVSPFSENNLIVVSWYWQHLRRFEDEKQITSDVQSKHLTDVHVNLNSVISHFLSFAPLFETGTRSELHPARKCRWATWCKFVFENVPSLWVNNRNITHD